ncbi:MAG: serine hydrolase, partial [Rhodospirillaceae bacterium]|nr:serine hydrolase [Rhodospirillaceae bacterium]
MLRWIARALLVAVIAVGAFAAWQWPYTANLWRAVSEGRAEYPDLADRLPVVEKVAGAPAPLPGEPAVDEAARFAEAISYAESQRSWSLLIWQGGRLHVEKYMNGSSAAARPESASMHKTVLAMVVGQALADGVFKSLDDPIGAYIEEWAGDDRGKITLRQLLSMSSGLTTTASSGGLFSETLRFQMGLFPERLLLSRQVARPPNTDFEYLNVNSNLVGLALQRSLGRRYAEYLSEKIWRPIGASDGYVVPARPGGFVKTSGTLLAQARDWLRVGLLLKDDGLFDGRRVLPEGWVAQMTASSATNPIYGMQVWRASPHVAERYYNN